MEIDPTPVTPPCLSLLGPTPAASGHNKRARTSDNTGEEETRDTAASGSGTNPSGAAEGTENLPAQPTSLGATNGENAGTSGELSRSEAIQAVLAAPLLPEPATLKIDHVTALLALAIGGPTQHAAIYLINQAYSK